MTFLEDCMCQQLNQWQVAMLAALYSVCQNGIPSKEFETFRSQFVQSYGCQYLPALHQLMKIGLLTERISNPLNQMQLPVSIRPNLLSSSPRSTFQFIAKRMNLIAASEPATALRKPDKMSYVFSGVYIPALCQVDPDSCGLIFHDQLPPADLVEFVGGCRCLAARLERCRTEEDVRRARVQQGELIHAGQPSTGQSNTQSDSRLLPRRRHIRRNCGSAIVGREE
jgi:hypothetical protein